MNEKLAFTKYLLFQELDSYVVLTESILRISGIREVHFSKIDCVRKYFLYTYYVWNIPIAMRLLWLKFFLLDPNSTGGSMLFYILITIL